MPITASPDTHDMAKQLASLTNELTMLRTDLISLRQEMLALNGETKCKITDTGTDLVKWVGAAAILQMWLFCGLAIKLLH